MYNYWKGLSAPVWFMCICCAVHLSHRQLIPPWLPHLTHTHTPLPPCVQCDYFKDRSLLTTNRGAADKKVRCRHLKAVSHQRQHLMGGLILEFPATIVCNSKLTGIPEITSLNMLRVIWLRAVWAATHQQSRGSAQDQRVHRVRCGRRGLRPPRVHAAGPLLSDSWCSSGYLGSAPR